MVEEETNLLFLWRHQLYPLINLPPRNRSINELSEDKAKELTMFTKDQLHLLLRHWRIPDLIVTGPCYQFTGEEVLIVCLARIASGDPWTWLIDGFFGGDPRRWTYAFRWFINHLFVLFYHKILGRSMEIWIPQINNFKQMIVGHLRQPAHPRELDYYYDMGERLPANQYVIDVASIDDWRVMGFIDDTAV